MKKLFYVFGTMALMAGMVACDNGENSGEGGFENIIEDGFYVIGEAVGLTEIATEGIMAAGINEVNKEARAGLFEKYAYIEADKEFELVYYAAGEKTRYGSKLESELNGRDFGGLEYDQDGDETNGNEPVMFRRGELIIDGQKEGQPAPTLQVAETGFYYIALDLNNSGDLAYPQILVCPVAWGTNGDIHTWKEMEETVVSNKEVVWNIYYDNIQKATQFKFSFGGGWKIQLDDAGNVKLETNLGWEKGSETNLASGGDNIAVLAGNGVDIKLIWKAAGGAFKNSFSYEITADEWIYEDPSAETFLVGFSGADMPNAWGDPSGAALAQYNAEASTLVGNPQMDGTYVYDITGLTFTTGEFKVRVNGGWYGGGSSELNITGVAVSGNDNLSVPAGNYDVRFTIEWKTGRAKSIKVAFTAK